MLYRKIGTYIEDYLKSDSDKILVLEGSRQIGLYVAIGSGKQGRIGYKKDRNALSKAFLFPRIRIKFITLFFINDD